MTNSKELFHDLVSRITLPEDVPEIQSMVYLLLEKAWGITRTDILAEKKIPLAWAEVEPYVRRINVHEPIQYILGEAEFFGRTFRVNRSVLIPRPETELLVHEIINHAKTLARTLDILDIGTGSGCIAISLALEVLCMVHGVDINPDALKVAGENASRLSAPVKLSQLDILKEPITERFDLVVSNPPYISQQERQNMKPNVLNYEPHIALFPVGEDAFLFYRVIARQAQQALKPGGSLWFEINEHYGKEISEIMNVNGFENVIVVKDWNGKDRVVWGKKTKTSVIRNNNT
ncbi:MAG: peptide chain release factor N(5)-glutamine methyltransferase [Cyclobacteriaceae bacterium]|nr:peptide chain release factor N(5)-glutamine methyltransferase [Cyclobacteriaceae bacterium]